MAIRKRIVIVRKSKISWKCLRASTNKEETIVTADTSKTAENKDEKEKETTDTTNSNNDSKFTSNEHPDWIKNILAYGSSGVIPC